MVSYGEMRRGEGAGSVVQCGAVGWLVEWMDR